jgi:hypothetical protein
MNKTIPVDEYRGLYRDRNSNSIINTDDAAYLKAKLRKAAVSKQKTELDEMKKAIDDCMNRCAALENEIAALKGNYK